MAVNIGDKFGRLTVVSEGQPLYSAKYRKTFRTWICDCECGTRSIVVRESCLMRGSTRSCGCLRKELSAARLDKVRFRKKT